MNKAIKTSSPLVAQTKKMERFKDTKSSEDKIPAKEIQDLSDRELCDFYFQALVDLIGKDFDKNIKSLRQYFFMLRGKADTWCNFTSSTPKDEIELYKGNLYYRLNYMYRNSTIITSAVAHYFRNVLNANPNIVRGFLHKRTIRICSLGGCPSDVVALVKVIESIFNPSENLDIQVTIVDMDVNWKETCFTILRNLERSHDAVLKIEFLQADLSNSLRYSQQVYDAIRDADVVSAVKFLSEMPDATRKTAVTKELFELVQPGSLIFVLDHPQREVIESCGNFIGVHTRSCLIYEEMYKVHTLQMDAVEKHFQLYNKHFGSNICNTRLNVFVRVWLKTDSKCRVRKIPFNGRLKPAKETLEAKAGHLKWSIDQLRSEMSVIREERDWDGSFKANKKKAGWSKGKINRVLSARRDPELRSEYRTRIKELSRDLRRTERELEKGLWIKDLQKRKAAMDEEREDYFHAVNDLVAKLKQANIK